MADSYLHDFLSTLATLTRRGILDCALGNMSTLVRHVRLQNVSRSITRCRNQKRSMFGGAIDITLKSNTEEST